MLNRNGNTSAPTPRPHHVMPAKAGIHAFLAKCRGQEASASFLKKRSKKLSLIWIMQIDSHRPSVNTINNRDSAFTHRAPHRPQEQKFFASPGGAPFFQKRSAFFL